MSAGFANNSTVIFAKTFRPKPADACTYESDGTTVRNLWRLEQHYPAFCRRFQDWPELETLVRQLVHGDPLLVGIETFNKPARVGSAVPWHQDNAYFCRTPPDMLTIWIAIDAVTPDNGPVHYIKGSHVNMLPARPSGVTGISMGLASPPHPAESELFCGLPLSWRCIDSSLPVGPSLGRQRQRPLASGPVARVSRGPHHDRSEAEASLRRGEQLTSARRARSRLHRWEESGDSDDGYGVVEREVIQLPRARGVRNERPGFRG